MLMVFAALFAAIIVFQAFFFKKPPAPKPNESKPAQSSAPAPSPAAPAAAPSKSKAKAGAHAATQVAPSTPGKAASSELQTVVENDLYRITFTNQGAVVKSWILKKYKDEDGKPLDLVNRAAAEKFGYPLILYTYDPALSEQINKNALYVPSATGTMNAPGELTFEYADDSVTVRKSFFFGNQYVISLETEVTQNGKTVAAYPAWPGGSVTRRRRRGTRRNVWSTWPTARWSGLRPRRSAAATPFEAPSTGRARRTSSSRPSSCLTIPTRR